MGKSNQHIYSYCEGWGLNGIGNWLRGKVLVLRGIVCGTCAIAAAYWALEWREVVLHGTRGVVAVDWMEGCEVVVHGTCAVVADHVSAEITIRCLKVTPLYTRVIIRRSCGIIKI